MSVIEVGYCGKVQEEVEDRTGHAPIIRGRQAGRQAGEVAGEAVRVT